MPRSVQPQIFWGAFITLCVGVAFAYNSCSILLLTLKLLMIMMVEILGKIQYVYELNNSIDIVGGRLYVFLKQHVREGKAYYEYLGSMFSTLEDNTTAFMSAFLTISTHYALPAAPQAELVELKQALDKNDRGLEFEGKALV